MTGTTNQQITARMARRSVAFARSPWTFIDQFLDLHPDLIYFGNGAPAPELYPVDHLRDSAQEAWQEIDTHALDYGELKGYRPLRDLIARRMNAQGFAVDAGQILITFGSQQGIDIASRLMLDPGDVVAGEGPTYIGALQAFDAYEPTYALFPVDEDGLRVDLLAECTSRTDIAPKLIYVVPNFQNPTGQTMSESRRAELIAFADECGALIVEDDPYGEFWYDSPPPDQLRKRSVQVAYLGTFSKTIAPGLRVGWMVVPDAMMGQALMAKEASEVCGVRTVTRTVCRAVDTFLDEHVVEGRRFYNDRRVAMLETLARTMPADVSWSRPKGGFFTWITLPEGCKASELLPIAAHNGVGFLPGRFFYPSAEGEDRSLRLSFSVLSEVRIREGVSRLANSIEQMMRQA